MFESNVLELVNKIIHFCCVFYRETNQSDELPEDSPEESNQTKFKRVLERIYVTRDYEG